MGAVTTPFGKASLGTLYLVSTPIGNLEDLSARAVRILGEVDSVLAEDTRRTRRLMSHFDLPTPLVSLHAHNEEARLGEALSRLGKGGSLALVSDAGTPLVSDPGERLVRRALAEGHQVVPLPGPSAVLSALVGSGFPAVPFSFLGFVPRKGKERARCLERVAEARETIVLFESPERLAALLSALTERCGSDRRVVVAREMTKLHEDFRRGTLEALARYYTAEGKPRGEVTVVIAPGEGDASRVSVDEEAGHALARELLNMGTSPSRTARELASRLNITRNQAYELVLSMGPPPHSSEGRAAPGEELAPGRSPDQGGADT